MSHGPSLVLGPMLRYVSATEATVWVECSAPCEVEILGHRAPTFHVGGHHYALVIVEDLAPGSSTPYEVTLDGLSCWPPPLSAFPPSRIQTLPETGELLIAFGSCRVAAPHELPYTLSPDEHELGVGVDALYALAQRLRDQDPAAWPRMLLLIGDQVYADEVSPQTKAFIRARRDTSVDPGEEVLDAEEYTWLYRESWSQVTIRWLHSTVPAVMVFDDHDVHDDWNTSAAWVRDARHTTWWHERILAALATYWVYQHLGNLSPAQLRADELYRRVREADDGAPLLREFAETADRDEGGRLWSLSRRVGGSRLVVIDSREGRVLDEARRAMIDEDEWEWLQGEVSGDFEHLLIASTLPVLLAPTLHYVEAWNEALCAGAWGGLIARLSEKLRRGLDLEHWAAFQRSFHRLVGLVRDVGAGRYGRPPASIVLLGGDVHQAYLEEVGFRPGSGVRSTVFQVVCSPFRNQLGKRERVMLRTARRSRVIGWLARRVAHAAGVREPDVRWRVLQPPTFSNQLGFLRIDGRRLHLTIESTGAGPEPELAVTLDHRLH